MHLLVVEDERILCETIVRSLRRLAYSVDYCYDGERALELLGVERYDLVLLDPPYGKGILQRVLPALVPRLSDDAMVVCESGRDEELPAQVGSFVLDRERRHGKTKIALYLRGKDLAE